MAENQSATQSNQNTGQGGAIFRDANASIGGLELGMDLAFELPISFGNAQSSATSGNVTISGDVVSGSDTRFGLAKMLILGGFALGLMYIWRRK